MPRVGRIAPLAALLIAGCQNQPTTFNNPFLAPDRVPPPSTRVLTPGAAQPYYPGDPAVGGTAPSYTPAPNYSPAPAAQPGAWNNTAPPPATGSPYTPTSSTQQLPTTGVQLAGGDGDVVRVPDDAGQLRFAGNQLGPPQATPAATPSPGPITPTPTTPPPYLATNSPVIQQASAVLPPRRSPADFPANSSVEMAGYQEQPQEVRLRAVESRGTPQTGRLSAPDLFASIDGFRPQGSSRRTFDEPTTRPTLSPDQAQRDRFGYDLQYKWLRGQLEQDPVAGQWRIRYQRADEQPDPFGGSVLIANPQLLGNLPPGAWVVLRGQLHSLHFPDGRTAPAYQLTVVQRQLQ